MEWFIGVCKSRVSWTKLILKVDFEEKKSCPAKEGGLQQKECYTILVEFVMNQQLENVRAVHLHCVGLRLVIASGVCWQIISLGTCP